jgi:lysozyme
VELIKEFEGCKLSSYVDPHTGGLPITIGWGSTKKRNGSPFHLGEKISLEEANALLEFDIRNRFMPALKSIPYWSEMNDNQRGALLSFAYNLGAGFYNSNNFNTISRNLREKNWKAVPDTLKLYRNPGSNVEPGLLRRRVAEGKLWITV